MNLFYGLICLLLTIGWMTNGTQEWIVTAICFAGLQIMGELVSAVARLLDHKEENS